MHINTKKAWWDLGFRAHWNAFDFGVHWYLIDRHKEVILFFAFWSFYICRITKPQKKKGAKK